MRDLISRQSAIDALEWKWAGKAAIDAIKNLPSAEPDFNEWCTDCKEYDQERHCCPRYNRVIREALDAVEKPKTGKWIHDEPKDAIEAIFLARPKCSECGFEIAYETHFCPNCGADMRGEDDGCD